MPKGEKLYKHGLSEHPLYWIHQAMKTRCNKPNYKEYHNYGGRGIKVCKEWQDDFICFYNWAISNGWEKGKELDRRDNNKGYSPENCRFVTSSINRRNTRRNIFLTKGETTLCIKDWAIKLGLSWTCINSRLKRGLPLEEILSTKKLFKDNFPHRKTYRNQKHVSE